MTELPKTRRGVLLHTENPFVYPVPIRTRRITNKRGDMLLVSADDGEVVAPVAGFWESEEVDTAKFVKLFVNGVRALKELTGAGTKVFELLYLRVQDGIGKDKIYMSYASIDQAVTPMSDATYNRGMRELLEKGFIAATPSQGLFWLNLDYMWNGDRLAFVKEYRRKTEKSKRLPNDAAERDRLEALGQQRLDV